MGKAEKKKKSFVEKTGQKKKKNICLFVGKIGPKKKKKIVCEGKLDQQKINTSKASLGFDPPGRGLTIIESI